MSYVRQSTSRSEPAVGGSSYVNATAKLRQQSHLSQFQSFEGVRFSFFPGMQLAASGEGCLRYRIHWVNDAGTLLATQEPFEAIDDQQAIKIAAEVADGDHIELWQGLRLVARLNAKPMPDLRH